MAYTSPGNSTTEDGGDVILNQQIGESLGAVTAGEADSHDRRKYPRLPEATLDIA